MAKMQLPSRVADVMAALKTQGYEMRFSPMADGDIHIEVYKDDTYRASFSLIFNKEFDMYDCDYRKMCDVVDPRVQKKSAAVLKYLEGIIEY